MTVDLAKLGIEVDSSDAVKASTDLDKLRKSADGAEDSTKRLSRTGSILSSTFGKMASFVGGLAAGIASFQTVMAAFSQAREFNSAMSETQTLIRGTAQEMAFLEEQTRSMGKQFGTSATAQVKGFYEALSAGATSVEQAQDITEQANKLAIGGATDVATGVDVLTSSLNAYAQYGLKATDVTDSLFVAILAGKTTAGELAHSLGQVLPIASAMGISFDEVTASVAALTSQGQSTSQAVTGVRGALAAVLKPTKQAQEMADALGLAFDAQSLKAQGLAGFLEQVKIKTGGSQEAMAQLFGDVEGLNAVLALTNGGAEAFADTLDMMAEKAGATDAAFNVVADGLDQRLKVQLAIMGDALLTLGNVMLQVVVPTLEYMTSAASTLGENLGVLASVIVAMAATQLPMLVASLVSAVTQIGLVGAATTALAATMKALGVAVAIAGGPWGILVGLIAGAAAYFLVFRDNAKAAEQGAYDAAAGTEALNSSLGVFYKTAAPSAGKAAIDLANDNIKLAKSAYDAAEAELQKTIAMNAAAEARLSENNAAMPFGTEMGLNNEAEAAKKATAALEALQKARADQKRAFDAISGSSYGGGTITAPDAPTVDIPSILDGLGNIGGTGIGGSDAVGKAMDDRLQTLMDKLQTEREALDEWRAEGIETLDEAYENELLTKAEHDDAMLRLEQQYQDQLRDLKSEGLAGQLGMASDFFSELATLSQERNGQLLKISKAFGAAEALVNTYRAAAQTLADPKLGFWAKFAAVAKVIAAGLGLVNAIKGGGQSKASTSTGGAREVNTQSPADQKPLAPQRVLIEGISPGGMISRETLDELFRRFYDLNKDRGVVFQLANQ